MGTPGDNSKRLQLELAELPRKPYACPPEVTGAWEYLKGAHASVSGLFATLNLLRDTAAQDSDPRGRLSHQQTDQLRAAITFTSAGLDACLRRLLRDALRPLVDGNASAGKKYRAFGHAQMQTRPGDRFREAVAGLTPRSELIDLYVESLTGSSLQGSGDIKKVRDALGLPTSEIPDSSLDALDPFFAARNEIAHELDLIDSTGRGTSRRRERAMTPVRDQCDGVFQHLATFIHSTATQLKAAEETTQP